MLKRAAVSGLSHDFMTFSSFIGTVAAQRETWSEKCCHIYQILQAAAGTDALVCLAVFVQRSSVWSEKIKSESEQGIRFEAASVVM